MSDVDKEFENAFLEATDESTTSQEETTTQDSINEEDISSDNLDDDQATVDEEDVSNNDSNNEESADYKALYEKAQSEAKSWKGRVEKAYEERDAYKQSYEQASTAKPKEQKSEVQDEDVIAFFEEYPEMEKPVAALARKIAAEQVKAIEDKYDTELASLKKATAMSATEQHFAKIAAAHPDYEQVGKSAEFNAWIEGQPSYIRGSIENIVQQGSADEIIEVLSNYKSSTGLNKERKLKEDANKKADSIMAVRSLPGGPVQKQRQPDSSDFDSAWNEATSAIN